MKLRALTVREQYTLGGILFGLSFPIFSQFIDCLLNDLSFTLSSIAIIHKKNVIHYVVDTAPVVLGAAGFLLGTTHQKKNDINQKLRQINESLDTLAYKITHDLRGPALNIKSLVEILNLPSETVPQEKRGEVLKKIHESTSNWLLTFEDFMLLLKHEKSGDLEQKECSLFDTVEALKDVLAFEIEESGAQIKTDFEKCPNVFVSEVYLDSILKNLMSNAIKYAHPERVPEITISSVPSNEMAEIFFKDNGAGIDLDIHGDKLFKLFERFSDNTNIPGSGIGLYLVKEQIEKNNGTITVDSSPNQGTTFTIRLPRLINPS